MRNDEYRKRLINWNSTNKYNCEVYFLETLLRIKDFDIILDYGCGTGFCLETLSSRNRAIFFGYDVENFFNCGKTPHWFSSELNYTHKFSKIYFMHSLAHIDNVETQLANIKRMLKEDGEVIVITPNKDFDDYLRSTQEVNHQHDLSVIKHFDIEGLSEIFIKNQFNIKVIGGFGKKSSHFHERLFMIAGV